MWRMWRGLDVNGRPKQLQVPMMKWITFAHWSRIMQAMLGDDAEIVAEPNAPGADEMLAKKVGVYMSAGACSNTCARLPPFAAWTFRACLFGRAHIFMPYEQEYFWQRMKLGDPSSDKETLCYDGPKMYPLWPSEIILPAQDGVTNVNEFQWKIRRRRITPQELLDGERRGQFQGIRDNWRDIFEASKQRMERNYTWDWEKISSRRGRGRKLCERTRDAELARSVGMVREMALPEGQPRRPR